MHHCARVGDEVRGQLREVRVESVQGEAGHRLVPDLLVGVVGVGGAVRCIDCAPVRLAHLSGDLAALQLGLGDGMLLVLGVHHGTRTSSDIRTGAVDGVLVHGVCVAVEVDGEPALLQQGGEVLHVDLVYGVMAHHH